MPSSFHYTSKENLESIKRSGYIYPSGEGPTKDAFYGPGVYLTSLDPSKNGKNAIAKNNYSKGWKKALEDGKLDCFIQIKIASDDPRLELCSTDRDIYLYKGRLSLSDYTFKCGENTEWDPTWLIIGTAAVGLVALAAGVFAALTSEDSQRKEKKR